MATRTSYNKVKNLLISSTFKFNGRGFKTEKMAQVSFLYGVSFSIVFSFIL